MTHYSSKFFHNPFKMDGKRPKKRAAFLVLVLPLIIPGLCPKIELYRCLYQKKENESNFLNTWSRYLNAVYHRIENLQRQYRCREPACLARNLNCTFQALLRNNQLTLRSWEASEETSHGIVCIRPVAPICRS